MLRQLFVGALFISLFCPNLEGQEQQKREGVYLKDGSFFVGSIFNRSGPTIDMVLLTGDTLHLDKKTIRRIKQDHLNAYRVNGELQGVEVVKKQKYYKTQGVFVEGSLGLGSFVNYDLSFGYRFKPWLIAGAGVAFNAEMIESSFESVSSTSPYLLGRIYLNKGAPKLYIGQKLGWFFRAENNGVYNRNGLSSRTQFGLLFANRQKIKWSIFASQSFTKLKYSQTIFDDPSNPSIFEFEGYNATFALGFGVHF